MRAPTPAMPPAGRAPSPTPPVCLCRVRVGVLPWAHGGGTAFARLGLETGIGLWGQTEPFPVPSPHHPLSSSLQGHPSSWCHPRTSLSTSPKMPFWRARLRHTRATSPTPGSRAAPMSSTSGIRDVGMAPRWAAASGTGAGKGCCGPLGLSMMSCLVHGGGGWGSLIL